MEDGEEYRHINQGSYGNRTEIGRQKVTNIEYNTVAPIYILALADKIIALHSSEIKQ